MLYLLLVLAIIALDQYLKYIINSKISVGTSIPVLESVFSLTHIENTGLALSLFETKGYLFIPFMFMVQILFAYFFFTSPDFLIKLSTSFIFAGGTGNLMSKLRKGSVTDFIRIRLGHIKLPIFNLADAFIFIGAIIFAINY